MSKKERDVEKLINQVLSFDESKIQDDDKNPRKNFLNKSNEQKLLFNLLFYKNENGWKDIGEIRKTSKEFGRNNDFYFRSPDIDIYNKLDNHRFVEKSLRKKSSRGRLLKKGVAIWRLKRNKLSILRYFTQRALFGLGYEKIFESQYYIDCSNDKKNSLKDEEETFSKVMVQLFKINTIKEIVRLNKEIQDHKSILSNMGINIKRDGLNDKEKVSELISDIKKMRK